MGASNLHIFIVLTTCMLRYTDGVRSGMVESNNGVSRDYCQLDTFNPQCMKNEVIAVEEALYGRHRIGKCITAEESSLVQDVRYFGCYANVTVQMDSKCSGKRQCEVRIPDADLERTRSCLPGLHMFLEVSYSCVEVVEPERSCTVMVTSKPLHLAPTSFNSGGLRCGTKASPWLLEAPAGQRINISLLDFKPPVLRPISAEPEDTASRYSTKRISDDEVKSCQGSSHQYGYVIDKSAEIIKKNISICGSSRSGKHTKVGLSKSSTVELVFSNSKELVNDQSSNFLIRFQAVGCTHVTPPEDAWVKRQDDKITIGCYTSRQTWQLRCQDGRWLGVLSNCNNGVNTSIESVAPIQVAVASRAQHYEVAVVVAVAFTCLAICLLIVCCGIVCLHRFYAENRSKWSNTTHKPTSRQDEYFEQSIKIGAKC